MLSELFKHFSDFLNSSEVLEEIVSNRFVLILLVIFLSRLKYKTYSSMFLTALVNIPGTFLHETAHFTVGFLLNARPTSYTLVPKKSLEGGYTTGSVGFKNLRFYNALPSAMAPLLLLPVGYYFDQWLFSNFDLNFGNYIFYVLLQSIIIENALPSSTDFRVGFGNILGVAFYGVICFAALIVWLAVR